MTTKLATLRDIDDARWVKWSKEIGVKPVFLFKAALNYIAHKNLEKDFAKYIKNIIKELPNKK